MCVLLLRGPQTTGEITTRGFRLHEFSGLEEVDATLNGLISREPDALVKRLPRQAGQKEVRYAHLLSGEPVIEASADSAGPSPVGKRRGGDSERVEKLEQDVVTLTMEVRRLQQQFEEFKKQFE